MQSKNWLFTINNPQFDPEFEDFQYLIYQIECVTTVHIQGYVVFNTRKRLDFCKRLIPSAHFEIRRGTHSQAKAYCSKEESRVDGPYEFGEDYDIPEGSGSRSDLQVAAKKIFDGVSLETVAAEHQTTYIRYHRGMLNFQTIIHQTRTRRNWKTYVNYYYGVSGSGKSFRAHQEAGPDAYFKDPGNKWFDHYLNQENVIFDDFRGNWFTFSFLLRLLDAYPLRVEPKGEKAVEFAARTIWITSNVAPDQLYSGISGIEIQALFRRIENVVYFPNVFGFIPPVVIE